MEHTFSEYRKTHNEGVFDAYPARVRAARHAGLLTGLPDAYGRGRDVYKRQALPTGYCGIYPFRRRSPRLYEQFSMPQ